MKVIVTGGAGFLGARLADYLLSEQSPLPVTQLVLIDVKEPPARKDTRVRMFALDLSAPGACERLIDSECEVVFHLAAVVSGLAEADFDLGMRVNLDGTRALLEAMRRVTPTARLVFTSTCAAFGGELPPIVRDDTALAPQTSYGTAKAMCELLINDYSRRGYVDGRVVRLPTVTVRAGAANEAVTSFVSGIVRDTLAGNKVECPVAPEQKIWVSSPDAVVQNLAHAAVVEATALGSWRVVNLPGICVTVGDMVAALRTVAGDIVADRVVFRKDEFIARIIATLPVDFDVERALKLGFKIDRNFEDIVRVYLTKDVGKF